MNNDVIALEGKKLEVNQEKTRAYYARPRNPGDRCNCIGCTTFYNKIQGSYPMLQEFLTQFGVDISNPDNISWLEIKEGYLDYLGVDYTVCGAFPDMLKIKLEDRTALDIRISSDTLVCHFHEDKNFFVITVYGMVFPYGE